MPGVVAGLDALAFVAVAAWRVAARFWWLRTLHGDGHDGVSSLICSVRHGGDGWAVAGGRGCCRRQPLPAGCVGGVGLVALIWQLCIGYCRCADAVRIELDPALSDGALECDLCTAA